MIDFFSYVGGVLGLFAGISVLSFFELFYFFTFRVASNIILSRKTRTKLVIVKKKAKSDHAR